MRLPFLAVLLLAAACSTAPAAETPIAATTSPPGTTDTVAAGVETSTATTVGLPCGPPLFAPTVLPDRVTGEPPAPSAVEIDRWTALPATSLVMWTDDFGSPVVALVRGALPPERWSVAPAEIEVRGVDAALGSLPEGMWAAAWYEGPDRCDDYTLYLYPPTSEAEAREVAESIRP